MDQEDLKQTAEGAMIERAAKATGQSVRRLATNAGISDTRWRQIVKGRQSGPQGVQIPVRGSAITLARMALVVGLEPEDLTKVGRSDAAGLLTGLLARQLERKVTPEHLTLPGGEVLGRNVLYRLHVGRDGAITLTPAYGALPQ